MVSLYVTYKRWNTYAGMINLIVSPCFTHIPWQYGASGEVRDCHKSSFITESAEMRLLCSDEGSDWLGLVGIGRWERVKD